LIIFFILNSKSTASLVILSQKSLKILLLDNYDSFTFNLFHYLEGLNCEVIVSRNDEILIDEIAVFDKIILSPGPGLPNQAGLMMEIINRYAFSKPFLGVCLGMQALAESFGDELYNLKEVRHGVASKISIVNSSLLFENLPLNFEVGLYHSWAVQLKEDSPFKATSFSEDGVLMSFEHKTLPIYGVQFHPESILTEHGKEILKNFIEI
jgi:anthranilate synthase component II